MLILFETLAIPVIEFLYAFFDFYLVCPAEAMQLIYIDELAWCAVGFCCIPNDFSSEIDSLNDKFGERADCEFFARSYIDVAVSDFTKRRNGTATPL